MIKNIDSIKQNVYSCGKILADYLIYNKKLAVLGNKDKVYYFVLNKELEDILKSLPIWLKILKKY
jgi:hypothetical protein